MEGAKEAARPYQSQVVDIWTNDEEVKEAVRQLVRLEAVEKQLRGREAEAEA